MTRRRIDELVRRRELPVRASDQMYEGLFLGAFTSFEAFLEDVFLGLLVNGKTEGSSRDSDISKSDVRSWSVARELVFGGRKYADWLPYSLTEKRAKLFFRGGRPFTDVLSDERQMLERAHIIRNAIAHRSRHSLRQFENQVIGNTALAPRERKPAGYLRGFVSATPAITRYENYVTGLLAVAKRVAT